MDWILPVIKTWLHIIFGLCFFSILGLFVVSTTGYFNERADFLEMQKDLEREKEKEKENETMLN